MSIAVKTLAISTALLYLKCLATITIQGGKRFDAGTRPPEDGGLALSKGKQQSYGLNETKDDERAQKAKLIETRWNRIVLNDLENIPIGLVVAIVSILANGNEIANSVLIVIFTLARIGHTIAYANEMQPHRTIFWTAAALSLVGITINGVVGAFSQ